MCGWGVVVGGGGYGALEGGVGEGVVSGSWTLSDFHPIGLM